MKNKFHKKRIVGLAAAMLCCSMILFGCGVGNNNTPKRQYDPSTRVPTDNGEQVFTIDQDTRVITTILNFTTATAIFTI